MLETRVQSLGREDSLEERMATHYSILAWKFPWKGQPDATVHGVARSWTQLNDQHKQEILLNNLLLFSILFHIHWKVLFLLLAQHLFFSHGLSMLLMSC